MHSQLGNTAWKAWVFRFISMYYLYVSGEFGIQRDQRDQQVFPFQDEHTK